jgi:AcrR family transcriptional regulator
MDEAPSRRPRDATKTRRDILVAAGQRFARRGYAHVTLKEIADEIGVTPAMIVRYFGSKRALFEEVAKDETHPHMPLVEGDLMQQLEARARSSFEFFDDKAARAPGLALLRSLDLDDGELFRAELHRRIYEPWSKEVVGPDADVRLQLILGVLMGVGLFSAGALTDPDRVHGSPADTERMVGYLAKMLAVCVETPTEENG